MRVLVLAVGRLKAGPERDLCGRYEERFLQIGRGLGMGLTVREVVESAARRPDDRKTEEARAILTALPDLVDLTLLEERGPALDSAAFARLIDTARTLQRSAVFAIAGADGAGDALRARASRTFSFGAMTLPHQLVRVLLLEQLYRAATVLAGHPYHRA